MIKTDLCVIGSGPAALYAVFEAGQFNMRCHVVGGCMQDTISLGNSAGALHELMMEKIAIFNPIFSADEWAVHITDSEDGHFVLTTNENNRICCQSVLIAGDEQMSLWKTKLVYFGLIHYRNVE